MNYEILSAFIGASALLSISPGPDNIFVLTQSIAHGKKYGLATVAGLVTGCLVHTSLVAFGVAIIIENNPQLFLVIKIFGAVYLLFLAYQVFKTSSDITIKQDKTAKNSLKGLFIKGFTMNVLNPKVALFFLAFFPGFLFSDSLGTVWQFYILGLLFMTVAFFVFGGIAYLAGNISGYIKKKPKSGNFLKWLQIIVFVAIAVYLILSDK